MAVNVKQLIAAGFERLDVHLLDTDGYAAGPTGAVTVGAAGAAAYRLLGVQTGEIAIGEPAKVDIPGDDTVLGSFIFAPAEIPAFTIETGADDLTMLSRFQSTLVEDQGDISLAVLDPSDPVYVDVALLAVSRAKSKVSGSDGVSNYTGVIVPKCNIVPLHRGTYRGREGAAFRWRVQPSRSDAWPWGKTLTDAVNGTTGGTIFPWSAENRVAIHRFTQDGAASVTVFGPLAGTPAGITNAKVRVFVNRVIQLFGYTVQAAARTITFGVAPIANAVIEVFYEYTV